MDEAKLSRLAKLERVVDQQKAFLHRIPDPDTRERAEGHLHLLIDMRDAAEMACGPPVAAR